MSRRFQYMWQHAQRRSRRLASRLAKDTRGVTAIEFAAVGPPFLAMLFGILAVALFFFTTFSLENAVEQAERMIRTGQVQKDGLSADDFKAEVCKHVAPYVKCDSKMRVNVDSYQSFGDVVTPSCTDSGGNLIPPAETLFRTGASSEVVLVTVCYEWELAGKIPFLQVGDMANGSALIQASTTFRTEPYED